MHFAFLLLLAPALSLLETAYAVSGDSGPAGSWCEHVASARAEVPAGMRISVPCEGLKPVTSAIVAVVSDGAAQKAMNKKGSTIVFTSKNYVNGALALGQSLNEHTTREVHRWILIREGVQLEPADLKRVEAIGWRIGSLPSYDLGKYTPRYPRYRNVYTKLLVQGMTEYECVLALDLDALIVSSIDSMLDCKRWFTQPQHRMAAALDYYHKQWTQFNTGVVLWRPLASEMIRIRNFTRSSEMKRFESDQTFMNFVYKDRNDRVENAKIIRGDEGDFNSGAIVAWPFTFNAQTHLESQLVPYWEQQKETGLVAIHFTHKKGWQCPEEYEPPAPRTDPEADLDCIGKKMSKPAMCFCREGYLWHKALRGANEVVKQAGGQWDF